MRHAQYFNCKLPELWIIYTAEDWSGQIYHDSIFALDQLFELISYMHRDGSTMSVLPSGCMHSVMELSEVNLSNSATHLNQTHIFEWCVVRCGS